MNEHNSNRPVMANSSSSSKPTVEELCKLMQLKGAEAVEQLQSKYGGVQDLARLLDTHAQDGVSGTAEDLERRRSAYGRNEIPANPSKPIWRLALDAFRDPTLIMLSVCALVSIALSFYHPANESPAQDDYREPTNATSEANLEWIEGVAIIFAVLLVVGVTAFNDWRKERQFRGLQARISQNNVASVVRAGQVVQVHQRALRGRHLLHPLRRPDSGRRRGHGRQRPQDRRVVAHRRDRPGQEEHGEQPDCAVGHARDGGQRTVSGERRGRQLADRHHHDAAGRSRQRGRAPGHVQEGRREGQEEQEEQEEEEREKE